MPTCARCASLDVTMLCHVRASSISAAAVSVRACRAVTLVQTALSAVPRTQQSAGLHYLMLEYRRREAQDKGDRQQNSKRGTYVQEWEGGGGKTRVNGEKGLLLDRESRVPRPVPAGIHCFPPLILVVCFPFSPYTIPCSCQHVAHTISMAPLSVP